MADRLGLSDRSADVSSCPMCGSLCRVISGDEGTSHYEPIWNPIRDERDRLRAAIQKHLDTFGYDNYEGLADALAGEDNDA